MSAGVALAFAAHPDDAEICFGGTLLALARKGWDVHVVVASVPDHRERRLEEVRAGADVLGVHAEVLDRPGCWQVEDVPTYELVREFDERVRRIGPARVFTHWSHDTHYDHVITARAVTAAMRGRHADLYQCEQANRYAPSAVPFPVNTYVDVSDVMEDKLEAVGRHRSQDAAATYTEHLLARARSHGECSGYRYAEAFTCITQSLVP